MHAWFVKSKINGVFLIFLSLVLVGMSKITLANNLAHEWAADEGAGSVVVDSIGSNHGSVNGATWVTTGYVENALEFNGISDSVEISGAAINTLSSFSVSAWVKLNSLEGWQTAVSQDGVNVSGFYLQKTTYGELAFALTKSDKSDDNGSIRAESSFIAVVDKWYHLVGVHDASSQEIKLFVNGVLESTKAYTTPWTATGNTTIGRAKWKGNKVDYFSGVIDEVKVYNGALSGIEAKNLFSTGNIQGVLLGPVDAVRLLQQATFGPAPSDVEKLKTMGAEAWIDEQLSLPATLHRPLLPPGELPRANHPRVNAWLKIALHADDQLRQRMAYALSQIFVVSQSGNVMVRKQSGLMNYYDTLVNGALGNYRDLMYDVTMHPVMGTYLTYAPNYKADPNGPGEADENYARELMQLMSLGPYLLKQNGEYQIQDGQRIPTYSEEQIKGFAKVFTGLCYADRCDERFATMETPMIASYSVHDLSEKQLLSTVLPANPVSVKADIDAALDDIFAHANTAPFVSKLLIQLLVTSNPTPAYVARVAAIFNNNGNGVKGDLSAVAKAILLDDEARNGHISENAQSYGKLKEPILMLTHYFRALDAYKTGSDAGEAPYYYNLEQGIGQAPLVANSVFNFFKFDYAHPGLPKNMVSPEFQLNTELQLLSHQNFWFRDLRNGGRYFGNLIALIDNAATREEGLNAYADYIDLMFTQGEMSDALRQEVIGIVNTTRARDTQPNGSRLHRFNDADAIGNMMVMLFLSPEFAIQR